jgi:hypothetical protein
MSVEGSSGPELELTGHATSEDPVTVMSVRFAAENGG